jgi:hypothetical protein
MYEEIDADEVCDEREPDDEDDEEVSSPTPRVKPLRFVLERGGRHVETYLICAGCTVRTDSSEKLDDADAAKKAYDRIRQQLLAEGYKQQ